MSSRNRYLSTLQKQDALVIHEALTMAKNMVSQGEHRADRLIAEATHLLSQRRRIRVIYIAVVDRGTMDSVREVQPGQHMMAIAAWVDEVRLIDNVVL
jgi:pantoate--beta-alanine ligase